MRYIKYLRPLEGATRVQTIKYSCRICHMDTRESLEEKRLKMNGKTSKPKPSSLITNSLHAS